MKLKTYSVTKLTKYIATLFTNDIILNTIRVEGEVSKLTRAGSGHYYFTLKDDESVIPCVMFKQYVPTDGLTLKDGAQVVISGKVSVFTQGGRYQLMCHQIVPIGEGERYAEFLKLKDKLQKLGYFSEDNKKSLPQIKRVGLITSKSGDAVHDFCSILKKRDPRIQIVLYPSLVQGDNAAKNIACGISYFNLSHQVDTIVITRGGGSKEDLWCFNDENLATAIFESAIPVVSAIGHQADFSISDFVADVRAATPSNAAELISQDISLVYQQIDTLFDDMTQQINRHLGWIPSQLAIYDPKIRIEHQLAAIKTHQRLLPETMNDLHIMMNQRLKMDILRLNSINDSLTAKHPSTILARGYVMATDIQGKVVTSSKRLNNGDQFKIIFSDGKVKATVIEVEHE